MCISRELITLCIDYMSQRQDTVLRPKLNEFFMHWRRFNGRYFNGYPCTPCPNCGDEIMWYRESSWHYDANGHIEDGKQCERCGHYWNNKTGEVWRQGITRAQVRKEWKGSYEPPDLEEQSSIYSLSKEEGR